ncbi:MAG: hypothetical protein FJ290_19300 [Planctomycetes bacterium]|nr:hypothetical protein [Planctomycetota bacterium]
MASRLSHPHSVGNVGEGLAPYTIGHYRYRFWAVYCGHELVAVTVYRKGAAEVARRLNALPAAHGVKEARHAG